MFFKHNTNVKDTLIPQALLNSAISHVKVIILAGKFKIGKLDVDSNPNTPGNLGVRSLPTLLIFKGGKQAEQIVGVTAEVQLKKIIDKVIAG